MIGKKLIIALACCSAALFVTAAITLPFTTLIQKDETKEASDYTITFESNAGTTVNSITITGGSKATKPTDPILKNYIFKGWYTDAGCSDGNEFDFENDVINGNITLYAKWEVADQFYISFDSQQGSFVDEVKVDKGGKISKPADPTREGYVFAGWYLDKECSESQSWNFESYVIDVPVILYAKWDPNGDTPVGPIDPDKFTVNYDSLGGSKVDSVVNLTTGSKISKPKDPTRNGYQFIGWYKTNPETDKNAVAWNFDTDTVTESMTLYAKWEQVFFEIQYVTEYGIKPETISSDKLPDTLVDLTERGYVFCGWYLEETYKNKAVAGTAIKEDTKLYAKWRAKNKYDELLEEPNFVIANDDFDNYKAEDRLPEFTSWDTAGIYSTTHKSSSSKVDPTPTTTYIQMDKGVAELVDSSDGASIQLVLASGKLESGIIEGYFEATLKSSGDKWTFFQLYGTATDAADPTAVDEIFGLRVEGGQLKYRVNKGTADATGIVNAVTVTDTLYKVYFTINMELGTMSITINDKPYLTDFTGVSFTSVEGFKFTSSDSGSKTLSVDYLIMANMNLSIDEYKAKMKKQAQADYDALNVKVEYPSNEAELQKVLSDALADIDAKTTISDIKKAYDTYLVNLDKAILVVQKQKLSQELDTYVDKSLYTNEQLNKKDLENAIATGKDNITKAETYNQAINALADAKKVIDDIPTDAELLDVYKTQAIAELKAYKNSNDYTQHLAEYQKAISDGETAIQDAQTIEAVDKALADAKAALDKIVTDADYLATIKANLCKELDDKVASIKANELADAQYASSVTQIETELANGKKNINAADTKVKAENAKVEAAKKIELILSAALKTMAQFKEEAIAQLNTYATNAGKGYNDAALLNDIETARANGETAINAVTGEDAAAKDAILAELEEAKRAIDACISDYNSSAGDTIVKQGAIQITTHAGLMESAYAEFEKLANASSYSIYVKGGKYNDFTKVDEKIAYIYEKDNNMRVDLLGLTPSKYNIKIVPIIDNSENEEASSIFKSTVVAYDRSGFAHFNYTDGVGAYKDDGTLKDNAIVIYVTDETKNTVSLTYGGTTVSGIGNILNSVGQACNEPGHEAECRKVDGTKYYYAKANTNQGILKKLAEANIPLVVRFVGCVSDSGLYKSGTYDASSKGLIDGLTIFANGDTVNENGIKPSSNNKLADYGGTLGDNGHMARMKSGKNITLEGIGSNAIIDGWGFHFMAESAAPELGKSFEIRNLTFINTPEDAIGMEGVQESAKVTAEITASVERCWIHHNEFYGPSISNPAESDKGEGDGSCDFKRGQYFTCSYNYFEGCHKTNLVGSADTSLQYNLTYHHNYWKLCKARGPLARNANIHMYNNVFEGQTDYAMNTRANAYIYSEYNLFYMCKSPQRVDSGAIKSYKDSFSSCINLMDGTVVDSKTQVVQNSCQFSARGIDYSKFDTNPDQSYIPSGKYQLQTSITEMRKVIEAYGGTQKDHLVDPTTVSLSQITYLPKGVTPNVVSTYPATLTPGKISKTVYAFTIDRMASVTVSCASNDYATTGILVNEAGETFLTGSGTVLLMPGTYMIQPTNFQPGDSKAVTNGVFKEITVNSIEIKEHNSEEFDNQQIADFEAKVAKIPSPVKYDDNSYTLIRSAMDAYAALRSELKTKVDYTPVETARNEYRSLGKAYVEDLIDAIGTVNQNSGAAISNARTAYNNLLKKVPDIEISNYSTLIAAEAAFDTYAVQSCIDKINAIPDTITLDSKAVIETAKSEYDQLDEEKQKQVTNASKLLEAQKKLDSLLKVEHVNEIVATVDMSSLVELRIVVNAYESLTVDEKKGVTQDISNVQVQYVKTLINSIGTVTSASGTLINEADQYYTNSLTPEQQALIDNYNVLVTAKEDYQVILSQKKTITFEGGSVHGDTDFFTVTANYKTGVTATYEGTTYKDAVKMESSTNISFGSCKKITIITSTPGQKIKIDGKSYTIGSDGILVVELDSTIENHTISKDSTNTYICAIIVE